MSWHNDFDGPSIANDYARAMGVGPYENDFEEQEKEKMMCECWEHEADYEVIYWNENYKNGKKFNIYLCKNCLEEFIDNCIEDGDSYEIKEIGGDKN